MNIINIYKRYKTVIIFLMISLLSIIWFKPNHLIYLTDTTFPFSPLSNLLSLFYYWNFGSFGGVYLENINISYFSIIYVFSVIFDIYIAQFLYYYIFVFIAGISTYYLMQSLFINNKLNDTSIVPYVPSILYMYSTYWISNVFTDPMTVFVFYSLLPLIILSLYKILINSRNNIYFGKYDFIFIISIFLFLPEFYTPYLLLLAYVLISFLIFYFLINFKMINIFKTTISVIILVISTIAVFSYFLIPTIFGVSSTLSQVSENSFTSTLHYWTLLNSNGIFYSFLNTGFTLKSTASTLYGWKWFNFYISYPFFIISNITIPILAFLSLFFIKKFKFYLNKIIYFFYFLAITGIILQAGLKGPTGFIYNWLFYHIVFIRAFDTLHLWYSPIIYLSYSIMVGASIYIIIESLNNHINKECKNKTHIKSIKKIQISNKNIKYIIIITILFILMIPSYPLLDGSAVPHGEPSAEVHIPNYVTQTSDYLNSKSNISNVLTLPLFIDDDEENYSTGGYRGTNPLQYMLKDPLINQLNGIPTSQLNNLTVLNNQIYQNNDNIANYYLSFLNIKYILVLGDYNSTYNPILSPFSLNKTLSMLNSDPNITLVKEYGPYYIYKYKSSHSLVYPSISFNNNNIPEKYGGNLISTTLNNYSYTNWGNNYSNLTLTSKGLSVYFNYTRGVTWPFMEINIYNISKNIQNYNKIRIDFNSTENTAISVQANTYYNTHLCLTGIKTSNELIVNTSYNEISELELFLGPSNTTYNSSNHFLIKSIVPVTLEKLNMKNFSLTNVAIPEKQSLSNVKIINIQYNNPTSITVHVNVASPSNFTLTFSQDYNPNWYISGTGFVLDNHILVNDYMNAWVISFKHAGNFTINITFKEEKIINYYGYISILSSSLIISTYIAISIRKKKIM